jgi:hypothetical protein
VYRACPAGETGRLPVLSLCLCDPSPFLSLCSPLAITEEYDTIRCILNRYSIGNQGANMEKPGEKPDAKQHGTRNDSARAYAEKLRFRSWTMILYTYNRVQPRVCLVPRPSPNYHSAPRPSHRGIQDLRAPLPREFVGPPAAAAGDRAAERRLRCRVGPP